MTRRQRDLRRLLVDIAEQHGAKLVDIRNTNGGHLRATFAKDKTNIAMILGSSPGRLQSGSQP
jgi:hypothetical protein